MGSPVWLRVCEKTLLEDNGIKDREKAVSTEVELWEYQRERKQEIRGGKSKIKIIDKDVVHCADKTLL